MLQLFQKKTMKLVIHSGKRDNVTFLTRPGKVIKLWHVLETLGAKRYSGKLGKMQRTGINGRRESNETRSLSRSRFFLRLISCCAPYVRSNSKMECSFVEISGNNVFKKSPGKWEISRKSALLWIIQQKCILVSSNYTFHWIVLEKKHPLDRVQIKFPSKSNADFVWKS